MAWEHQMVDVTALDEELERAQLTNREIAKRERRDEIEGQVQEQERKAAQYTRAMEGRDEKKTASLAGARMPLDGLALVEENNWDTPRRSAWAARWRLRPWKTGSAKIRWGNCAAFRLMTPNAWTMIVWRSWPRWPRSTTFN